VSSEQESKLAADLHDKGLLIKTVIDTFSDAAKAEVRQISKQHVSINMLTGFFAVVIMLAMMFFGVRSLKSFDAAVARADQHYIEYQKDKADTKKVIDDLNTQISTLEGQVKQKQQAIVKRDKQVQQKIADYTAPSESNVDVVQNVKDTWGFYPTLDSTQSPSLFEFTKDEVQTFNAAKLDQERLDADLKDTQSQLQSETQIAADNLAKFTSMKSQNDKCEENLGQYRKTVHKGKFRKFLDGAKNIALPIGGAVIGWLIRGAI
jgi:cell division septum initiation protein DivIVA